jgi:hypothetical protein
LFVARQPGLSLRPSAAIFSSRARIAGAITSSKNDCTLTPCFDAATSA